MSASKLSPFLRAPGGRIAGLASIALFLLAMLSPIFFGETAERIDTSALRQGSSSAHWLGTDDLGRDVLARVLVATRMSVGMALTVALCGAVLGVSIGAATVLLKPRYQRWINTIISIMLAMPGLLLAMFLAAVIGVGALGAVIAITVAFVPFFARLAQTLAASIASADYIAAARLAGVGHLRILRRHVLLNIAEPLIINTTLAISSALIALSGLSFLGLGVQAPSYDWGQMLNTAVGRIYVDPVVAFAPAIMIIIAGLTFNILGEALSQAATGRRSRSRRVALREDAAAKTDDRLVGAPAGVTESSDPAVRVRGLRVSYPSETGPVRAVRELDLDIGAGEIVGIVGESGSGKSQAALAIAQLVEAPAVVSYDRLSIAGRDLDQVSSQERIRILGTCVATVFQDPMSSFNPALRMGSQLTEGPRFHLGLSRSAALAKAIDRLREAKISRPDLRVRQYPHELSGGMRQRSMIAMGLMGTPRVIIADEPTTALDVTVQRGVLDLLRSVNEKSGASILFISHDIAVISQMCHRVLVMYAGRVIEDIKAEDLIQRSAHPYTRALVASVPSMDSERGTPLATIAGRPPDPREVGRGCAFAPRCALADERCRTERPPLEPFGDHGQLIACWKPQSDGSSEQASPALEEATR